MSYYMAILRATRFDLRSLLISRVMRTTRFSRVTQVVNIYNVLIRAEKPLNPRGRHYRAAYTHFAV